MLGILSIKIIFNNVIMKLGIDFGKETINVFANQVMRRIAKDLMDVVGDRNDLTPSVKNVLGNID